MDYSARSNRGNAFDCEIPLSAFSRLLFPLDTIAKSLQIVPYFFSKYFIFSQWSLIFDIVQYKCLSNTIKSF